MVRSFITLLAEATQRKLTLATSAGTITGKAVLLEDVIYTLSLSSDYYKNATLSYVLGEVQHKPLVELFREKRIL